jgi:hypothetical protein
MQLAVLAAKCKKLLDLEVNTAKRGARATA